jgi:molybdate-binding protein/transcriptional regulator with XRE-family HTH domain
MSRLRFFRSKRGWTQAELARRSGVSRSSVTAIESGALVPSVKAALALARALDHTVEELFAAADREDPISWAWSPPRNPCGYLEAAFGQKTLTFPAEPLTFAVLPPDGWCDGQTLSPFLSYDPERSLVLASCDPAVGLLATLMSQKTGVRLLAFHRPSREALSLLKQGVVHAAGMHLREVDEPGGNAAVVLNTLGNGYRLMRGAVWHEGPAVRPGEGLKRYGDMAAPHIRWIGRKEGSGARRCQDKVLEGRQAPDRLAHDHWEVAVAVSRGWADAGVCHRLTAELAGLDFHLVSKEAFDFCYPAELENDPRIEALRQVVRSAEYRKCLEKLAGLEVGTTGDEETV